MALKSRQDVSLGQTNNFNTTRSATDGNDITSRGDSKGRDTMYTRIEFRRIGRQEDVGLPDGGRGTRIPEDE